MRNKSKAPFECPVCGASVPPNAKACPECGADERSGWNEEDTRYDGLDLPEEAYGDGQTGKKKGGRGSAVKWFAGILALLLVWLLVRSVL